MTPVRFSSAIAAFIAFVVAAALTPVARMVCAHWNLFDSPGPLKTHAQPIPRLGGVALVIAVSVASILTAPHRAFSAWPFFAALTLVWSAGFVDDLRGLSPFIRLVAQFSAGGLSWMGGWHIAILGSGPLGFVAVCVSVAALANAMNLLDGMDALATGVAGIIAVAYLALPTAGISPFARVVGASVAGACLGFLPYNWPTARIFLGDSGATLLGFAIAFLGLDFYRARPTPLPALFFPLFLAAVPIFDAFFAAFRRLRSRKSPFLGDRRHVYDLMRARGWQARAIVFTLYAITAAFAAIASCGVRYPKPQIWISAGIGLGFLLCVAIRMGSLRGDASTETAKAAGRPMSEKKLLAADRRDSTNYFRR